MLNGPAPGGMRKISLQVPIVLAGPGTSLRLAADVFLPPGQPRVAMYCLPGGGVNRQYFDLQGDGNSFAQAMTARGAVVVALDHLGVGDSEEPEDRFILHADRLADANAQACRQIAGRLAQGTLAAGIPPLDMPFSIGVGHSMGAMLTVMQQDAAPMHAALALLCFSTRGLPEVLSEEERHAASASDGGRSAAEALARARFAGDPRAQAPRPEPSSPASIALAPVQDKMLQSSAMLSMLPNNVGPEAARITVPLFLGLGERDIAGRPHRVPAAFPACREIVLHINEGAGHHPFVAARRRIFFDRIGEWMDSLLARRAQD